MKIINGEISDTALILVNTIWNKQIRIRKHILLEIRSGNVKECLIGGQQLGEDSFDVLLLVSKR